ncbi:hypothetical protein ACH5RR_008109 [Cinchona calisaya]|uniref:FLZ-type domain-containing protein n=1 Tax=Cinchona calisaya TaxID=153742 RepID=A0ABD3ADC5_9GENT
MNISRLGGLRRNKSFYLLSVAAAVPRPQAQNRIISRSSSSDLSEYYIDSESSVDSLSSTDSINTISTTFSSSSSSSNTPNSPNYEEKDEKKPGLLSLLANKELDKLNIMFNHQLKLDNKPSRGLFVSAKTEKISEKDGDDKPYKINPLSENICSTDGLIEFGLRDILNEGVMRVIHNSPCVFEPVIRGSSATAPPNIASFDDTGSEIRGHVIISPEGFPCFRPLTFCTVHKSAGFLRLEDIQNSECYSRVEHRFPNIRVIHRFNNCVLEFPPTHDELIVFKGPGDGDNVDEHYPMTPPPSPAENTPRDLFSSSFNYNPYQTHAKFLHKCLDCFRPLDKKPVYIYRGETWFCSEDCRYWNIKEAKERERRTLQRHMALVELLIDKKLSDQAASGNKDKAIFYIASF